MNEDFPKISCRPSQRDHIFSKFQTMKVRRKGPRSYKRFFPVVFQKLKKILPVMVPGNCTSQPSDESANVTQVESIALVNSIVFPGLPCIDETSSANCLPTCMWFTSRFLMLLWSNQSTLTGSILCHTPSVRAKTLVETLLNVSLDLMQILIFYS